jgi:hypothetical protein
MPNFKLFFAVSSLAFPLVAGAERPGALLERVEAALDRGFPSEADSLFAEVGKTPGGGAPRHRREIARARLAAARGDWRGADKRLDAWKRDAARGEGSGEILFWQGWSALHQGKKPEADSLFVLASAYTASRGAQDALEYRFAALLEKPPVLLDYLRGLPESPLPDSMRLAALERVPKGSRLHPYAQWQLALLLEVLNDTLRSREVLTPLAGNLATLPGRKAAARLNYWRESSSRDSAATGYEGLLMKQQQGVSSEFARKRLQNLR